MIDDHVHQFPLEPTTYTPANLSLDVTADAGERRRDAPHRLTVELLTNRLAGLLGVDADQVEDARTAASGDWPAYVSRLLDDADVAGMVMDPAWAPDGTPPVARYAELAGRPVWELQRLEPTVDRLIEAGADANEIVAAVDALLADAAARGVVGVKTVLAYRTGLGVDPAADLAAAQRSLAEPLPVRRRGKALRDLLLRRALGRCADFGLPIQVHTGFGDGDIVPRAGDPLQLDALLRTPEGRAATVVLIHGSWPWHDALAYLASVHRNVVAEFSLVQLFAPVTTAERLLRLLDAVPADRVLLGSDGHGSIESIWWGCALLRDAWAAVRARLVDAGARPAWVDGVHDAIFEGNARRVYALGN